MNEYMVLSLREFGDMDSFLFKRNELFYSARMH